MPQRISKARLVAFVLYIVGQASSYFVSKSWQAPSGRLYPVQRFAGQGQQVRTSMGHLLETGMLGTPMAASGQVPTYQVPSNLSRLLSRRYLDRRLFLEAWYGVVAA